ncbi:copper chaperone PCu(A)C [Photobacterium lucens]|uniref:copper chaperone PCu(A)C n=1 Tax=Photobacterium lucens TaxID=2562949 RepID=UPI00136F9058|nr:copper chaperone PCu(A)C [Photobacterium lucens]MBP2699888.1 copper chaperone PCu(A)C [Vibrio parahaemolyticus]MZG56457.1 copper chaperone PCu(A)C [Photobacterium lucens]MZG81147.1 copper chaperone PCu(A)C [Photobacterium lucens]
MRKYTFKHFIFVTLALFVTPVLAEHHPKQNLELTQAWSKEVPLTSQVAAAFITIKNHTSTDDELLSVSSPIANKTELHEHLHQDGMMKMRQVSSIPITANSETLLKPGGFHIMFFDLKQVPELGEIFPMTLTFKNAGRITVNVKVEPATFQAPTSTETEKKHMHHHH